MLENVTDHHELFSDLALKISDLEKDKRELQDKCLKYDQRNAELHSALRAALEVRARGEDAK